MCHLVVKEWEKMKRIEQLWPKCVNIFLAARVYLPLLRVCWPLPGVCWPLPGVCWPLLGVCGHFWVCLPLLTVCWPLLWVCWPWPHLRRYWVFLCHSFDCVGYSLKCVGRSFEVWRLLLFKKKEVKNREKNKSSYTQFFKQTCLKYNSISVYKKMCDSRKRLSTENREPVSIKNTITMIWNVILEIKKLVSTNLQDKVLIPLHNSVASLQVDWSVNNHRLIFKMYALLHKRLGSSGPPLWNM